MSQCPLDLTSGHQLIEHHREQLTWQTSSTECKCGDVVLCRCLAMDWFLTKILAGILPKIYSKLLPYGHPAFTDTRYYGQNLDPQL